MADNQSTIALNIGTQRISMAVFEPAKSGGLVLKAYDSESILPDPATEASRAGQIREAISSLVGRMKAKGKVRYAISGQAVFIRFVKLPPLDADDIEQLVTFEAQQHVPFPLDEVVWDYEILEAGGDKEVVIVAIKGDALEETNDGVNSTGLGTAEVDVAPMALYNAFRAAYPNESEPVLVIDIGAKTSDLLYIEGERFFTRSAAMGGSTVTTAISKEFSVPFAEAEAHKTQNGLVALGGGHTEQLDEGTAALAMSIRNSMTRLATEIPRTTNYYRSQHGGNAPKKVLLAGGGANLPYAKEFFEEKLRLPVEYFNPLPAISVGPAVDTDTVSREAHLMGELVGLGLRGSGKAKLSIDLVPAKVGMARAAEKRKPFLIAAAAVLVAGAALWALFQSQAASAAGAKLGEVQEQVKGLQPIAGQIDRLTRREGQIRGIADAYMSAEADRTFWIDALAELKDTFASDALWLTDIDPLVGYDPLSEKESGKSAVKQDFAGLTYGQSASEQNIKVEQAPPPSRGNRRDQAAPAPAEPAANAVRLKGFWLKNSRSQNLVYDLLKKLRENEGSHFRFSVRKDGQEVTLEDSQVVKAIESAPAPEEFAAPFTIILPLSREVPIR